MSEWKGPRLGGINGQHVSEDDLRLRGSDFSSVQTRCEAIGMDCRSFVFYHTDLGPTNIDVKDEPKVGNVGIIDFETAGYLPWDWIRTKFPVSSGIGLCAQTSDPPTLWRSEMAKALGTNRLNGFREDFMEWRMQSRLFFISSHGVAEAKSVSAIIRKLNIGFRDNLHVLSETTI